eukprot:gene8521-17577_t
MSTNLPKFRDTDRSFVGLTCQKLSTKLQRDLHRPSLVYVVPTLYVLIPIYHAIVYILLIKESKSKIRVCKFSIDNMSPVTIPSDYGLVLMSIVTVMTLRKAFKSKRFLEKKEVLALQEEHKKECGTHINDLGYPDMGCGRYSQHLEYGEWLALNNAMRAHYNMIESSAPILVSIAVTGLVQPRLSAMIGLMYGISRLLYSYGYNSKAGADGRMVGAAISFLCNLFLYSSSIYQGAAMCGFTDYVKGMLGL